MALFKDMHSGNLDRYLRTAGREWKKIFGCSVRRLPLSGGFSCPNRDGSKGTRGCAFCSVSAFSDADDALPIAEQMNVARRNGRSVSKFLAYFQSYTGTYAEIDALESLYCQAASGSDVVGLCVATRPDAVTAESLKLLSKIARTQKYVLLELGLQTAKESTLKAMERGHGFSEFKNACAMANDLEIPVCVHLMAGLPGESLDDNLETLEKVVECGISGIKLHPLNIVKGSRYARMHAAGQIRAMNIDEYARIAGEVIAHTPKHIVYHRISATSRPEYLIAPDWCLGRFDAINAVRSYLEWNGVQGSALYDPYEPD